MQKAKKNRRLKKKYRLFPILLVTTVLAAACLAIGTFILAGITYAASLEAQNTHFYPLLVYGLAIFAGSFLATKLAKATSYFPAFLFSLEIPCFSLYFAVHNGLPISFAAISKTLLFSLMIGMISYLIAFALSPKKSRAKASKSTRTVPAYSARNREPQSPSRQRLRPVFATGPQKTNTRKKRTARIPETVAESSIKNTTSSSRFDLNQYSYLSKYNLDIHNL